MREKQEVEKQLADTVSSKESLESQLLELKTEHHTQKGKLEETQENSARVGVV